MKINESRSIGPIRNVRRYGSSTSEAVSSVNAPRNIQDTASVLGIPAEEMTPKVRAAIMQLMEEVDRARRDLDAAQSKITDLEKLADQDPMTHMTNRRAFVRELGRMISFAERYDIPTSLVYFDVNDLKSINDSLGHPAGDAAILHVARIIQQNIRGSDVAGRLGGDEFAILLPNAGEEAAQTKAASLAHAIHDTPLVTHGQTLHLKVAYGASSFRPGDDAATALASADRAMYAHKKKLKTNLL
ncbi:GGDEF domain-containing protein [Govanella unica]|uniref:diguanylate cyclase n=1 Tax=Govanella unica TaxID=2975056 RepID=A0A9X3U049_9PROT|nr:GGDEF domain-containing protein [Govania unica]MDA5194862.1 GGDEF domain-containing protein [Govania unica]